MACNDALSGPRAPVRALEIGTAPSREDAFQPSEYPYYIRAFETAVPGSLRPETAFVGSAFLPVGGRVRRGCEVVRDTGAIASTRAGGYICAFRMS